MLELDRLKIEHVQYLLNFCGAHRNCGICPEVYKKACKRLETEVLNQIKYDERKPLTEDNLLMILNLREYCNNCERCIIGCKRQSECDNLMYMIIDDHKANKQEKPKVLKEQ